MLHPVLILLHSYPVRAMVSSRASDSAVMVWCAIFETEQQKEEKLSFLIHAALRIARASTTRA